MKNLCLLTLTALVSVFVSPACWGQSGSVYTVAGGGTSSADGVPATTATLTGASGIGVDAAGNVYIAEVSSFKVRKVDAGSGMIYTIAGTGTNGYTGDGGPATSANIGNCRAIFVDGPGNVYFADQYNYVIRKIDASTGIISTIIGGGTSAADGIPATSVSLAVEPLSVWVDAYGNVYCPSSTGIRKMDATTGMITTVAPGTYNKAKALSVDNYGNIYIIPGGGSPVYKVDGATGAVSTIAGGGLSSADGVPATSAYLSDAHSAKVDGEGNLFIADWSGRKVRRVDAATGIITTIAGMGSGGSSAEGVPAMSADVKPYQICVDPVSGNIYYSNFGNKVRRFSFSPIAPFTGTSATASDSFYVNIYKRCLGADLVLRTQTYHPGMSVKTWFGDGSSSTVAVLPAYIGSGGYAAAPHIYSASGTYSIKHVLYSGTTAIDSFIHVYVHTYCTEIPVKFYFDGNASCAKEGTEPFLAQPVRTEVDSNGTPVDTITAANGFTYIAYGNPGDSYSFRILSLPTTVYASCPSTGINTQVLPVAGVSSPVNWFALNCSAGTTPDMEVTAYVPVTGPNDQWGHIYVRNNNCFPANATVDLTFSPKYIYTYGAKPVPATVAGNNLTWNIPSLSTNVTSVTDIYYVVWHNPSTGYLVGGDTVREHFIISSASGTDTNPANNAIIKIDTVRASCDPNLIEVNPPECFDGDTTFKFSVHFENTGNDTADNIYVLDTLSDYLDPATLAVQFNSHEMYLTKSTYNTHTIFRFDFPNIKLLDSSQHGLCDGLFTYTIRPKTGLPNGTDIESRVGIYFDYNDVVMTNTVVNKKGCPPPNTVSPVADNRMAMLYPNPANESVTINAISDYSSYTITNYIGQAVVEGRIQNVQTKVDVSKLSPGVYILTLRGEQKLERLKFLKE
jgi:hypothetical protein